jgi:hypothetical protein
MTAEELVARSTEASGVPFHCEDTAVLARVAHLIRTAEEPAAVERGLRQATSPVFPGERVTSSSTSPKEPTTATTRTREEPDRGQPSSPALGGAPGSSTTFEEVFNR